MCLINLRVSIHTWRINYFSDTVYTSSESDWADSFCQRTKKCDWIKVRVPVKQRHFYCLWWSISRRGNKDSFKTRAVRGLVLYPMNALVNDHNVCVPSLDMRTLWVGLLIDRDVRLSSVVILERHLSRYPTFRCQARYTPQVHSRDIYHKLKNAEAVLISELKKKGKWPAKHDLLEWWEKKGQAWKNRTHEHDLDADTTAFRDARGSSRYLINIWCLSICCCVQLKEDVIKLGSTLKPVC